MTPEQARAVAKQVMDDARSGPLGAQTPARTEELIAAALLAAVSTTAKQLVERGEIKLVMPTESIVPDDVSQAINETYRRGFRDGTLAAREARNTELVTCPLCSCVRCDRLRREWAERERQ